MERYLMDSHSLTDASAPRGAFITRHPRLEEHSPNTATPKSDPLVTGLDDLVIGVVMTCHNRARTTERCLQSLLQCRLPRRVRLKLYLTDDGCTDDTVQAARTLVPDATIISADGSLFWCGGMRVAMRAALEDGADFVLWLNDDVVLAPDAFMSAWRSMATHIPRKTGHCITVGSTTNPETGHLNYGGLRPVGSCRLRLFSVVDPRIAGQYEIVDPARESQCETMAGQFVLIPREVALAVGEIEPKFIHWLGDVDYGYRARKLGFALRLIDRPVGTCPSNGIVESWKRPDSNSLGEYWHKLNSIKALNWRERLIYYRRHAGAGWWLGWALPYLVQVGMFPWLKPARISRNR